MIQELAQAAQQLTTVDRLRTVIGQALTSNQQMAISVRLTGNPLAFEQWIQTDDGRAALRELADKFTGAK